MFLPPLILLSHGTDKFYRNQLYPITQNIPYMKDRQIERPKLFTE